MPLLLRCALGMLAIFSLAAATASAPVSRPVAVVPAQQTSIGLAHFKHDRWTQEDGAPPNIIDIAQGSDGYLWLASTRGLFRYDGVSFETIALPSGSTMAGASPTSLLVSSKGELWVGFGRSGGVAVYQDGHLVDTRMPKPPRVIVQLVETANGSILAVWGGISGRLWRWNSPRWEQIDTTLAMPDGYISGLVAGRDGSLWASFLRPDQLSGGVARLAPGRARFEEQTEHFERPRLFDDPAGNVWVSDSRTVQLYRMADGARPARAISHPQPDASSFRNFAFDRWGGLWGGAPTTNRLFRIRSALASTGVDSTREELPVEQQMRGEDALSMAIDGDGALWVGGSAGLQRFRYANFNVDPIVPADTRGGIKLATARDGGVWVISRWGIYRIGPGGAAHLLRRGDVFAICAAEEDAIWFVNDKELSQIRADGSVTRIASVPTYPTTCSQDGSGRLWIRDMNDRIWEHDAGGWREMRGLSVDGHSGDVELVAGRDGSVAIATDDRTIALVSGSRIVRYDLQRIGLRGIIAISPTPSGFLVATASGLGWLGGGKMRALSATERSWTLSVDSIVTDDRGSTWLRGPEGISRVRSAALERAFTDGHAPLERRLFDFRDSVIGGVQRTGLTGLQATKGADGRIWFASDEGLLDIDPAAIFDSPAPPRIVIRNATTLASHFDDPRSLDLPAGTRSLRLVYAVMGLADPDRVQVRYKLEGVDPDWVDPGSRRAISYSNLGPGTYHFRVIAASASGVWNRQGVDLQIRIKPLFVESWPFKLLCLLAALLLLWAAFRVRLRIVAAQIHARLAERHDERERIARELHDTLLQSVQALILRFQLGTENLPTESPARRDLERTLTHAERILAEGRERVRDMRPALVPGTLEPAMLKAAQDRNFVLGGNLCITTSGRPRAINAVAASEIVRISEEALFNIARHARATQANIVIEYRAQALQITIRDNGVGIDPAILREGRREGHFGLVGMRERARKLRGDMMLDTGAEGGTEIILMVPGRIAYARPAPWWRRNPFRAPPKA